MPEAAMPAAVSKSGAGATTMTSSCRVAIIGAGPYGLAVASHLREAGIECCVFGEAMSFWRQHMPVGMLLRSEWAGSHIADPRRELTLDRHETELAAPLPRRLPLADFVSYGLWYQTRAVPDLDPRQVAKLSAGTGGGFRLTLDDGSMVRADRVVVATGLTSFARRPGTFGHLPVDLAPHATDLRDPGLFRGLKVAVVGAGQSAIESAVLLGEAGAEVEIIARAPQVYWLSGREWLRKHAGPLRRLVYPPGEVGPPGINWIVEFPDLFRCFPTRLRRRMARRAIRPAGSGWLRPRLGNVRITTGRDVAGAVAAGSRLRLDLDDGSRREVDRVVLATGFQVDLGRSRVLDPELLRPLRRLNGAPWLGPGLESSVPGLHFVGAAAAESFGPLMRFVAGSGYAARAVTRRIAHERALQAAA
jgi:hypothetical protein